MSSGFSLVTTNTSRKPHDEAGARPVTSILASDLGSLSQVERPALELFVLHRGCLLWLPLRLSNCEDVEAADSSNYWRQANGDAFLLHSLRQHVSGKRIPTGIMCVPRHAATLGFCHFGECRSA